MAAGALARGDGVGIEIVRGMVRGVRLGSAEPGRLVAAAEVPVVADDDRSVLDGLVRLRADLGDPDAPTRVAIFPTGSTLTRVDVTGRSGNDINQNRSDLATTRNASTTMLVDDGPRRWLLAISWDDAHIRRVDELAQRAGFVGVALEPSPLALIRVLHTGVSRARRDAWTDQSFATISANGVVMAAATVDSIGRTIPDVAASDEVVSAGWFDHIDEPAELAAEVRRLLDDPVPESCRLELVGAPYPDFPAHDLRSAQRQCVALGAAIGAAGLAGRLQPIDILVPAAPVASEQERPWAIERMSSLADPLTSTSNTSTKRWFSKARGRRPRGASDPDTVAER